MTDFLRQHFPTWTLWLTGLSLALCVGTTASAEPQEATPQEKYQQFFRNSAHAIATNDDLAPLYQAIGDRRFVLLGESSHGTREYYQKRAQISQHLITHKGFRFVGVEGDWPSIYRLNEYVKLRTDDEQNARAWTKQNITRWPSWMWANEEFLSFIEWLREHNAELDEDQRVGLFGLDMQDPESAITEVLQWLRENDKDNYEFAADVYSRILDFPEGMRGYARYLMGGGSRLNDEVADVAARLRAAMGENPAEANKDLWVAKQNALVVKRAEAQFHAATTDGPESWNTRARFMHEQMLRIAERYGDQSRGIVWAHNTHVGDSAATDMRNRGEVNIGRLTRESEGSDQVFILGFGTNKGEVVAGHNWGAARQVMTVPPAQPSTYEALMHNSGLNTALLLFTEEARSGALVTPLHQRAIGVIYRPPNEAYVPTILTLRYDGFLYIDETQALRPLKEES
ncbi:erythromycin esterase family protein [Marinimicrobium sp. ABcell2]|uniref:erythromycin esterase family protein n=1 Tax=Marinimicrobium sp. ABcell2 TaxID=3069751 RepID=UPI0027B11F1D|nr:erythromycin esterase family protein [Marinimicrobium sp. ABcell2]MDQ2076477.1 erythromycin esterase family protein [Marinimicrobium sp. ABcell2]